MSRAAILLFKQTMEDIRRTSGMLSDIGRICISTPRVRKLRLSCHHEREACLSEDATSHYHSFFSSNIRSMDNFLSDREEAWEKVERPWISVIEKAVDEMERSGTLERLDSFVCTQLLSSEHQHFEFWRAVDQQINVVEGAAFVADFISSHAVSSTPSESMPVSTGNEIALDNQLTKEESQEGECTAE